MTFSHNVGYIILLFNWKMSKSTKIALTRSGDYSDDRDSMRVRQKK